MAEGNPVHDMIPWIPGLVVDVVDAASAAQDNEPQPVPVPPPLGDQLPILVIQEEEPLKILTRRRTLEPAIDRYLPRGQETLLISTLRHRRSTYATPTMIPASQPARLAPVFARSLVTCLFCSERRPGPARRVATARRDLCPETGRMRLG